MSNIYDEIFPAGVLTGPIVKPIEWRKHNDSKRFLKDWQSFITPWKQWRRYNPITLLDNMLWEREKNLWRKWWFTHTPAERKYMIDRRNEYFWQDKYHSEARIFQNAQYAKQFKGPRYQRGSIMMSAQATMAGAQASGATLSLSSANNFATNIDVSPPGPLNAGFGVIRDGTHDRTNSGGTNQINSAGDWVTPRTSTVGDDYEVIWNILSSTFNDENYTEDVWTTINVTGLGRYVGHSTSAPSVFKTFEIDIGDVGTSTSDVNQDYSVECGDLI